MPCLAKGGQRRGPSSTPAASSGSDFVDSVGMHVGEDVSVVVARNDIPAVDLAQIAGEKSSLRLDGGCRCSQRPLLLPLVPPGVHVPYSIFVGVDVGRAIEQSLACMHDISFSDASLFPHACLTSVFIYALALRLSLSSRTVLYVYPDPSPNRTRCTRHRRLMAQIDLGSCSPRSATSATSSATSPPSSLSLSRTRRTCPLPRMLASWTFSEKNATLLFLRCPPLRLRPRSIPTDSTFCAPLLYPRTGSCAHQSVVHLSNNDTSSRRIRANEQARTRERATVPQLPAAQARHSALVLSLRRSRI